MHNAHRSRHDVVIVGGRVAGSATAMLLARLGHDVAVVDRRHSLAVHRLLIPSRAAALSSSATGACSM
jgi:2-polyprenyl-6-methoxyphenol hydroxylase-like FAD-dependent oxidoreductase